MNQYQIFCKPRHTRYMFFIDINYPYQKVIKLIHLNQRLWGGRYNPIIPLKDGAIMDGYLEVVKRYDPDFIFYSNDIKPEVIQRYRFFNPNGYYNLDEEPLKEDVLGVDACYFVSQFENKSSVLMPEGIWKTQSPLLEYYRINFGLTSNGIISDYEITKGFNQIKINPENFSDINRIIHEQKPINKAHLSKRNLNTIILRNLKYAHSSSFEIVIAKDKNSNQDLLYYWNRHLYQCRNIMYMTLEEVLLLTSDRYFGGVLYDLSSEDIIDIVSFSLTKKEIEELIVESFNKVAFHRKFRYKEILKFPFEVIDGKGLFEREYGEETSIQSLLSEENLLFIPKLSFTNKVGFYPQKWAADIQIKRISKPSQKLLNFPLTTDVRFILKGVEGRVNTKRNISFYIHNQLNTSSAVEINIPEFSDLLSQLIKKPVFQGTQMKTKYVEIGPHDSSNKMNSFIRTFNFDFNAIDEFFIDKFWVDIFETLCTSEKAAGDSISFNELLDRCVKIYDDNKVPLGKREETYRNLENLGLGLQEMLKILCDFGVFLQGFKVKCPKCSSIFWYQLKEAGRNINCKGCLDDYNMPIELKFSYKLNDLIKNNIFQSKTQRDGNLTVIRTLINLSSKRNHYSFEYSSQINLYSDYHSKKPANEIDIVALVDGSLIIGEAKHDSKEFGSNNHKSLNSLIEVAKDIFPDKIIISCYKDEHSRLDKAKKYLEFHFKHWEYSPEIEALVLREPDYFKLSGHGYFYY